MNEDLLSIVYGGNESSDITENNKDTESSKKLAVAENNKDDNNRKIYCADCGELIKESDNYFTLPDGNIICEKCYDENYYTCDRCGEVHYIDDAISVNGGEFYVCEDCASRYYHKCMECDEYFDDNEGFTDNAGNFLCRDCMNNYVVCDECGEFVNIDRVYVSGDYYYCEYCFENCVDNVIYGYHDFDNWDYKNTLDDSPLATSVVYYGFEIEVAGNENCAERAQELLDDNAVLMHDSSVDGFEIVTHPMTLTYFYDEFLTLLNNTLNYLKANDFTGHDAGGIHVHVSKCALSNDYNNKIKMLHTILSKDNIELWKTLTQRKEYELTRWAELYPLNDDNTKYQAVNEDSRTNTIEFRIFNSNLRLDRILKNFQIVTSLIDYVNEDYTQNYYNNINNYIKYVYNNRFKYMNLYNFMIEKQVIKMEDLLQCA